MTDETKRAAFMLRVAAKFLRQSADQCDTIFYDEAVCDAYCCADDCEAAADGLEVPT